MPRTRPLLAFGAIVTRHMGEERRRPEPGGSDERFRLAAMAANDVIWDWDLVTDEITRNDLVQRVYGYAPHEVKPRLDWWMERIHPDDRDRVFGGVQRAIAEGETSWADSYRFRRVDGSYVIVFDRGFIARDPEGRPVRMVGATQNISDRRAAEIERDHLLAQEQLARSEAEAANRSKSEFLAAMSHEFRTPLNAILGYAQLLDMGIAGPITQEQQGYIDRLRRSGQHLLGLVDDVLDLSKAEAGQLRMVTESASISEAAEGALALVRPQAAARNLVLVHHCHDPSVMYAGDQARARQVLVNLLSNAVKFTPPGGRITILCGAASAGFAPDSLDAARSWVYARIEDTGIGISETNLAAIFDPFTQAEAGHTRPQGGTGLGLTISRRLARLMGGEVTATSEIGRGSSFTLWLPVAEPAQGEATRPDDLDAVAAMAAVHSPELYEALLRTGRAIQAASPAIVDRYVERIRGDSAFPHATQLRYSQVSDHAAALIGNIASTVVGVGDSSGEAPQLMRDGTQILRLISELHGVQRHALGWTETLIERELSVLHEEMRAAAMGGNGDPDNAPQYALDLVDRLVRQSSRASVRGFRLAATNVR